MKILGTKNGQGAMTLIETLMASALLCMFIGGFITVYIFGLRMYEVAEAKTGASDDARISLGKVITEIRSAWLVRIGEGTINSFQEVEFGKKQEGSAIQIYATSNTTQWVRYYLDKNDYTLKRVTTGSPAAQLMAHAMATNIIFTCEDFLGNPLTNNWNNRVIGLQLHIKQFQYPVTKVGQGGLFDFYQINTKITRRKLE